MKNFSVLPLILLFLSTSYFYISAQDYSLRFHGHNYGDLDRVKISIDAPHRPVDVGNDFTIEFWMKAYPGDNSASSCGPHDWYFGNVVIDRDVFGNGDYGDYGIVICNRRIVVGVQRMSNSNSGVTGNTIVDDGQWHHIAVTRNSSTGGVALFVDGVLDAEQTNGPSTGNVSYRDGRPTSYPNSDPYLVFAAEKHDYSGSLYYKGWLDEIRISNIRRYTSNFTPPVAPFSTDANTVGLYHFNEGTGTVINDSSGASGGPSNGVLNVGGTPPGPVWSRESPFNNIREVTKTTDSGHGSLRNLLNSISSGGIVYFAPELQGDSIVLDSSLIINKQIEIKNYYTGDILLKKSGAGPCIQIQMAGNLTLDKIKLKGGTGMTGRVILNDGYLHMKDVVITDIINTGMGSAVQNNGDMIIENTTEIKEP